MSKIGENIVADKANFHITINGKYMERSFSEFATYNEFTYGASPTRTQDGTLHNDGITTYYVPTAVFSFNLLTQREYMDLMQMINSRGFIVTYYDIELGKMVTRKMYMSEKELSKIYGHSGNISGLLGVKFTMVSIYTYTDYQSLNKEDERITL